jgi:hypothetical protein
MKPRIWLLLFLSVSAFAAQCFAQTGTATFYSVKRLTVQQRLKVFVPNRPIMVPFIGWLFDGKQNIAHAQMGRFMSFQLSEGNYHFSVLLDSKAPLNSANAVDLKVESGGHYCFRLSTRYKHEIVNEAGGYKPIDTRRIDPSVRSELVSESSFPEAN